jgi:hypothetical protein
MHVFVATKWWLFYLFGGCYKKIVLPFIQGMVFESLSVHSPIYLPKHVLNTMVKTNVEKVPTLVDKNHMFQL